MTYYQAHKEEMQKLIDEQEEDDPIGGGTTTKHLNGYLFPVSFSEAT